MGSYQIWPCHVTQAESLSFPYLKSYCPLNFRKSHQISLFCCIPNGSYKEDNLKEGRICPAPPPPPPCGIGLTKKHFGHYALLKIFSLRSPRKCDSFVCQKFQFGRTQAASINPPASYVAAIIQKVCNEG